MSSIPGQAVVERKAAREDAAEEHGRSYPLGATIVPGGANFSVFSRGASGVELLLFGHLDDTYAARVIPLDPAINRTYHYWHVFVPGVVPGQFYGCVVVDSHAYDWEGDRPLKRPSSRTIIYEMHVRGFTQHPSSGVRDDLRGTYAGLIEKIPYLQQLGITAVELLPIFQFDPQDAPPGLANYWGYAPVSFFAPHQGYCSREDPLGAVDEFRDMVKALHRAGIEVILDVVFNHTAEGDHNGPTISFRGLDNSTYYVLETDRSRYANYSGTGNTLNANHPIVRHMIVDSLRYWVQEMHVDGFRFDLASILSRDSSGQPMLDPPVLWDIESDPTLAGTKMIAEAWDAAGLYQVGSFAGDSWREWNGRFRDDVRSFFRGDEGSVARIADRLLGSPQIYGHKEREAEVSVNFVTSHDGFTLNDLVSYNQKHNDANGESNRDGANDNRSWNCGVEGPASDPAVDTLRNRHVKNLLTCTMLSLGMPMIVMGDEVRRTQYGNNNAYCQDNETSWFDWSLLSKHADVHRFVQLLIERRLLRDLEGDYQGETLNQWLRESNKAWHGVKLNQPDWSNWSHSLALTAEILKGRRFVHWILNAYWEPLDFELPAVGGEGEVLWRRWIDTGLESPEDIVPWQETRLCTGPTYRVGPQSVVVLYAPVG